MEKKDLLKKIVFKIPYKSTNEKFMLLSSFLLLSTATIFSIINNNDIPTIIPCHTVTIPIINGLSTLICFILFFTKENFYAIIKEYRAVFAKKCKRKGAKYGYI